MKRSQVISMDFIMTFVIYMFAISVFFLVMKDSAALKEKASLDVSAELLFSRLDQVYNEADFLDGYTVNKDAVDGWNAQEAYDFIFRDFDDSAAFKRTDYCIYLDNRTYNESKYLLKLRAWDDKSYDNYLIDLEGEPHCSSSKKIESIVLSRPVLYGKDIMNLKILICAEKR